MLKCETQNEIDESLKVLSILSLIESLGLVYILVMLCKNKP